MRVEPPDPQEPERRSIADLVAIVIGSGAVAEVHDARLVHDGMEHVVVALDEKLIARFPRERRASVPSSDETVLLAQLAGRVTAPLPVPVFVDDAFTLHRMLHGADTTRRALAALRSSKRERLLDEIGRFLCELSAAQIPSCRASPATTSADRLRNLRSRAEEHLVPLLWRHQREWLDHQFTQIEGMSFDHHPTVIHGDLAPYHMLHDADTGELRGILDFGVAGLGDAAVDLGCLLSVWGERFAGALARSWPAADAFIDRARLLAELLPVEWAATAIATGTPGWAVAHLGHAALDIAPYGSSFGR